MGREKTEIKCPWCGEVIQTSEVEVKHYKNAYGTLIDRRCTKCNKVLASYLEEEGDFLHRMRTF